MFRGLLHRPVAVSMVLIALCVLGFSALKLLPVSLMPAIDVPEITVQVSSAEMSARELNKSVVEPLNSQLVQVSGLQDIHSETKDGSGVITMRFDFNRDVDYLFVEVNEKIDRAMNSLPKEIDRPKVMKASATDIPAFYVNLTVRDDDKFIPTPQQSVSPKFVELSNFATQVIVKRIEQLADVAMVDVSGYTTPEILVIPDMTKLEALGVGTSVIENALRGANVSLGNLTIRDGEYQFNVRFESNVADRREIENLYIKIGGRIYQLRELAQVIEHSAERSGKVISDGKEAISLAVIKRSESKMADLKRSMNSLMRSFSRDYPDIEFTVTRDQTELLDYSIQNLINNLLVGMLLACVVIFFFMQDFRSPAIVVATIPITLIITMLLLHLFGISINIISLAGLVLGVGMMVDNSIIVVDNITYRWQSGMSLEDAAVEASREVFAPMLSSVLTTCSVFIPLIFVSGVTGAMFYDQSMAVTITLLASLVVSAVLIPVFYYMAYRRKERFEPNRWLERLPINRMYVVYESTLKWLFRRKGIMWGTFALCTVLGVVAFVNLPKEILPPMSHTDALINVSWNKRITLDENTRRCAELVENMGDDAIQATSMVGVQQFVLSHTAETALTEAVVYVKTASPKQLTQVKEHINKFMHNNYPDAVFEIQASGNVLDMLFAGREEQLVARLRSTSGSTPDPSSLDMITSEISCALPEIEISPIEWQEHIEYVTRPEMMALYGVSYGDITSKLQQLLAGNRVMTLSKGAFSLPVVMGERHEQVSDIIANGYLTKNGVDIPLSDLVIQTRNRDLKSIVMGTEGEYYHLGLEVQEKDVPKVMKAIREVVSDTQGFEVEFSGSYFSSRALTRELMVVLVIAILLLYFILASQFESLIQPLIILSELVIDIAGALLVLWIFGVSINLMSLIGIVAMCGIVINDSILKVDTINHLRKNEGRSVLRAVVEAGGRRLKPIVMTSLTTILAIAPFLIRGDMGSDLQYPLSMALIGGMFVGTLVSVFFVPILYYEIYKHKA